MSKQELDELLALSCQIEKDLTVWKPLPGPQTQAYYSKADILFYGGAAGGGKTDLLLGLAHTAQTRSIIFRREYPQLKGIEDRAKELFEKLGDYNKSDKIWLFKDHRQIEFGAMKDLGDEQKFQGRAHDLKGFDEITHFLYMQFIFVCGWMRNTSKTVGQRTRVVCTGNPPTSAEGDWVIDYWGPWLDDKHPNPAGYGELRFYTNLDGKELELKDGEPFEHKGELIIPKSRTFIPASVEDNPYLINSGYKATLQSLPEPLRSKLLKGMFSAGREDDPWQVIPSEWVLAAQARWLERPKPQIRLTALGVDIARGGADRTVLTQRYGNWFSEPEAYAGSATPDGPTVSSLIMSKVEQTTVVNIDVIGVGYSVYDILKVSLGDKVVAMNGACASDATDRTGLLSFINKRAEWYWKVREALDPETGDEIALPTSRELMADLCAPRWSLTTRGIKIEMKEEVKKRLGRSTDYGDSYIYAAAIENNKAAWGGF